MVVDPTEFPTIEPTPSIPTANPTVDYGVVSLSFEGNYDAEVGESRNQLFIDECTAFVQSFGDVHCFAVYSGSVVITFYGGIEFVTNAANSIIREDSLSLPGFSTLILSPNYMVSTKDSILQELRQTDENAQYNEITLLSLTSRSSDSDKDGIDNEEIVVIMICIFAAVALIMAVCWLMEVSGAKDLREIEGAETKDKDTVPTPWLWEEENSRFSGGAGTII